ncbi:hypothetical protein [Mycobacterium sp. 1274761.0]|uniref:hypothetical protein n=1 Tax=Mycobacterium sp. 1274761.0 TaxID=1834077 RepID=UPI0009ECFF3A|nr:hypothetical protein [Mycobacterium sp. 1274761.0]
MTIKTIAGAALISAVAIPLGSGVATAAPSGPSNANETIARLHANGNRVLVNKVGTGPLEQCTVTSVRTMQTSPPPTGNPLTEVPNLARPTTVHLGLKC